MKITEFVKLKQVKLEDDLSKMEVNEPFLSVIIIMLLTHLFMKNWRYKLCLVFIDLTMI